MDSRFRGNDEIDSIPRSGCGVLVDRMRHGALTSAATLLVARCGVAGGQKALELGPTLTSVIAGIGQKADEALRRRDRVAARSMAAPHGDLDVVVASHPIERA